MPYHPNHPFQHNPAHQPTPSQYNSHNPIYHAQNAYPNHGPGQVPNTYRHPDQLLGQQNYQQGNDITYEQARIFQDHNPTPSYQSLPGPGLLGGYSSYASPTLQHQHQFQHQHRSQQPGQPHVQQQKQQQQQQQQQHGSYPQISALYGSQQLPQNQPRPVESPNHLPGSQPRQQPYSPSLQQIYPPSGHGYLPPHPGQQLPPQAPPQKPPRQGESGLFGQSQSTPNQQQPPRPQQHQFGSSSAPRSQLPTSAIQRQASQPSKTKQPRTVSHVQIPARKASSTGPVHQLETPRAIKRRKSNDGLVCETSTQLKSGVPKPPPPVPTVSSPLTDLASSQLVALASVPQQTVDLQAVLLSLSDEYISAAHAISSLVVSGAATEEQTNQCHGLLATGMGCLYAILNNYRQTDARKEARIRLQLASLLLEETENDTECAEVLSKGVALCDRSRLSDAKFAMHHVEVRLLFKTKPKAALKKLDKLVAEATEMKLIHWTYVFRFLRVSLGLQVATANDMPRQLENTNAISALAGQRSDVAVQVAAACLETVVHLHSGTTEAVESAQRSLTAARTHQLGPEMQQLPQLAILMDCLALACDLVHFSPTQIESRLQKMQDSMDKSKVGTWMNDGFFLVPLGKLTNPDIELDTAGVIKPVDGQVALQFCWLTRTQVMAVGYLLSGLARLYNNTMDKKSEAFLKEGMKMHAPRDIIPRSLAASRIELEWRALMGINSRLLLMFAQCDRSAWTLALHNLQELKIDMDETFTGVAFEPGSLILLKYLEAVIHHGLGDLDVANKLYTAAELHFDPAQKEVSIIRDCQALASLSHIQILRSNFMQQEPSTQQMLDDLEPYCRAHPNKSMPAAYHILRSTSMSLNQNNSILKKKQFLESAVRTAQSMKNNQILCMVLNLMREAFFNNIVGTQAEQNGRAARTLAKRTNSPLWYATAASMYSQTLDLCSMHDQAAEVRAEGEAKAMELPADVKDLLKIQTQST
nr:hypothetical protein CFP56_13064 [Quercus suber]